MTKKEMLRLIELAEELIPLMNKFNIFLGKIDNIHKEFYGEK